MTTTGAAKNQDLVRGLGCKVILVEEAAEASRPRLLHAGSVCMPAGVAETGS